VRGWAPPGLLDSYGTERRAEGERVLLHTRAQGALMGYANNERIAALREVLRQLFQFEEPVRHLVSLMYALDTRYPTDCDHPLAGHWSPASALAMVAAQAASGRGVLLDLTEAGIFARQGQGWRDRLECVVAPQAPLSPESAAATALLIRPDGYVAWAAAPGEPDTGGLRRALTAWFGAPAEDLALADARES
jgi:hypothetical protein